MSLHSDLGRSHAEGAGHSDGSEGHGAGAEWHDCAQQEVEQQGQSADDMEVKSNGNYSSGNYSSGNESNGHVSHENNSQGRQSVHSSRSSSSGNGKDSALLLETTESNKSSNSQSPSPPSSSIAYSFLSASSEQDHPSTSGCSSEQSARVKTQKELMKALKHLKIRLPSEKRSKGKSNTLATLQYALSCVKQVQANQEYYQQWTIEEDQPCCLDLSTYTIAELERITSEYTLKNSDTFSVAVSFITGKILYISDQAAFILRCKRDVFKGAKFVEFLAPQDVSVFYSSTAPYRLPSWSVCSGAVAAPMDYTQEKSVFCRISGARGREHKLRYHPFRLTPYMMKVCDSENMEGQPCCLLLAEKIHSGYEAPRIPADKRIFTTRHTPSCLFQEVDERAVPLLGYLPQDLIGTPVLFYLHPEDRPLMLTIHKKILQYAGQPFEHSPIRFCARNGEYVTMDTSWSSFVNPWNRKVSFIMGRHKVRTAPLNEDVFMPPKPADLKLMGSDIQELTEQIHRLLLQHPVHSNGSMGYCSIGSSTSHEQFLSIASSSDGNGIHTEEVQLNKPMTFQQICKDVHKVKNQGQQVFIESRSKLQPKKQPTTVSEKPKEAITQLKDSPKEPAASTPGKLSISKPPTQKDQSLYSYQQINCLDSIIRYLENYNIPNAVKRKCASSCYTTSSSSDSDNQKASEDAPAGAGSRKDIVMLEESPSTLAHPVPAAPSLSTNVAQDKDQYKKVGLTKEVLSIHTQKEEQAFLSRFKDLSELHVFDPPASVTRQDLCQVGQFTGKDGRRSRQSARGTSSSRHGKSGKSKAKRVKHHNSSDSTDSPQNQLPRQQPLQGPTSSSWPPSGTSQASLPFPTVMPAYSIPVFPPRGAIPPVSEVAQGSFVDSQSSQGLRYPMQPAQFPAPLVTPMVAFVLPNYMFPQMNSTVSQMYFPSQPPFGAQMFPFGSQPLMSQAQPQATAPDTQNPPSRSTTPFSMSQPERAESPLFNSRCSSPLQLNLLQLEETPKSSERQEGGGASNQGGGTGSNVDWMGGATRASTGNVSGEKDDGHAEAQESSNNDAMSTSSDLLDFLLQEDSRSGTGSAASGSGSAASGSLGSGSNGCSTSASGTRSSQSSNTSKYFGSIDSSENDHNAKKLAKMENNEQFIKYVLQDPIWLLMANTDDKVMMTYQMPVRDMATVLREDKEKLKLMQKHQPKFTESQKMELSTVHPWMKKGLLPKAIDVTACAGCGGNGAISAATPYDVQVHDLEFCTMLEPMEEGGHGPQSAAPDSAMEAEEGGDPQIDEPCSVGADNLAIMAI
ncbi:period circadian protein homolog 1 isoform X2 [Latimeria chalumnae]|uniref:period circadian protein homolog 1 isoform X2 n=1 Tax=Latimeria chalumnae TaxID=7897 RepID=UPI00313BD568